MEYGMELNQWARLQDGNHAYKLFGNLLKNGTLDNLLEILPAERPWGGLLLLG